MKIIFKDLNKVITKQVTKYTCPFCNRSLDVYSELHNSGGVSCYDCNWRISKFSFLINNKNYKLHSSFLNTNNEFNISFNLQTYIKMICEEKFDIDYFINYYLSYSENLIFM